MEKTMGISRMQPANGCDYCGGYQDGKLNVRSRWLTRFEGSWLCTKCIEWEKSGRRIKDGKEVRI